MTGEPDRRRTQPQSTSATDITQAHTVTVRIRRSRGRSVSSCLRPIGARPCRSLRSRNEPVFLCSSQSPGDVARQTLIVWPSDRSSGLRGPDTHSPTGTGQGVRAATPKPTRPFFPGASPVSRRLHDIRAPPLPGVIVLVHSPSERQQRSGRRTSRPRAVSTRRIRHG